MLTLLAISLASLFSFANGLNAAIFALDLSGSQLLWNVRVAHTLVKAGHNVTLIRLQPFKYRDATARIDPRVEQWQVEGTVHEVDYEQLQNENAEMAFKPQSALEMLSKEGRERFARFSNIFAWGCEAVLKNEDFMRRLKTAKFDIAFSHMYDYCAVGLIHVAEIATWIWLNSATLMDYVARDIGAPMPPSYVPPITMDASDKMTFAQRVKSFFGYFIVPYFHHQVIAPKETEVFRRIVDPNFPDLRELSRRVPLVMVNSDEFYDLARPTLHKVVNIGGLGMKKAEANPLPAEYAKLVDAASSVVVFTFGSVVNASLMPYELKVEFMNAFRRFPETQFFFRYPLNDIDAIKPKNVLTSKWLPQNDLLQHPKTRALISHGGYNSLQEAINSGTPIITIALFGDQFRNGRIAESQGFGYFLEKGSLTEDTIAKAIQTVLSEDRYSQTVKKIQRMVDAKPRRAEENLVKWTEFLAEFKELPNLEPYGVHLSFAEYHSLDNHYSTLLMDNPADDVQHIDEPSPSKQSRTDVHESGTLSKPLLSEEPSNNSCDSYPVTDAIGDEPTSAGALTEHRSAEVVHAEDETMGNNGSARHRAAPEEKQPCPPKKYHFDEDGKLVDEEGVPFKYTTSAEYEIVAASVTEMVYDRLTQPPLNLKKLSLIGGYEAVRDEDSFVFISDDDFDTADKLVVLIHGSGQVRAGQWSRRLIINESLDVGSQIPYIRRCRENGWAVLVTNTNDNYYIGDDGKRKPRRNSGTALEHGVYAFSEYAFRRKNFKKIAIVAHSFGGYVTGEILRRMPEDDARVVAVCLTDAFMDSEIVRKFHHKIRACNWVCSSEPLDTKSDDSDRYMDVVSAGTKEHERSSHSCIGSVFKLIDEAFAEEEENA